MAATTRKQETLRQMRGYRTGNGGVVLTLRMHGQKQLPHRADLDDAKQAGHKDEPLNTNMKEHVLVQ